ncbi:MAG TPA: alpha-amylase family protein [Chloroflexia bacterium]|nr:alpha-amylase family protein [Chloroflexia bacterium]
MLRKYWYKEAVIYCLDVGNFLDGNSDGIGDFNGLASRIDYLNKLGISCIWLMPFYKSPRRDNGYDVMDYYAIDPDYGSFGDFVEFVRLARERGIRVIIDLVVNHTSDQHHWFQAARKDKKSRFRNYYIWSKEKPKDADKGIVFPGYQKSTWTYDEESGEYYFHRFYDYQPDLNIDNPEVREEICKIMGFWLQLGISGFRVDAAPFLIEMKSVDGGSGQQDDYEYLREFRDYLSLHEGDAIMLAEANVSPEDLAKYFGDGDRMNLLFNFILNQRIMLAFAREEVQPIIEGFRAVPPAPMGTQWANFLRNHDELSLDKLSEEERQEVFAAFGPKKEMQIFDRGIRRRLAPMLNGDQKRLEMAYSLLLSLPGTPVLRYGQEIGMGDDLSREERNSIRTPMQWSNEVNAGFSSVPPDKVPCPPIKGGDFGYEKVNVASQHRDPDSLMSKIARMISARRECPELGIGSYDFFETDNPAVLIHRCQWDGNVSIMVHNLSKKKTKVKIPIKEFKETNMVDLLADQEYEQSSAGNDQLDLEGYGYRWFRLGEYSF